MKSRILTTVAWAAAVSAASLAMSQGYSTQEAVLHMTTAKGLKVSLFASEPEVRQPIFVKCDDRGRLWTIQYLQYPNPAGLTRVKIDRWSRTEYDRVPEPPPRGPRGADRITILTDIDGDGHADQAKDFIDGLNLVTGVEFGHGGVYVLNVPYLLFYPDANHDDVPDSDPQVLLSGFGMEDAQAMSNHLTWGPDGWLYGVNGSTTTCRIRGIEFQQGVWRYHPVTHVFELFCEGASNCYGLTFDANGELFYSTNGGPFANAVQGGYFYKSFGKHGPLHNLHAYHYFPELERDQVPGGPPTGGTVYLANSFPSLFRNTFIAGNFLGHTVSWWNIEPAASTVRAKYGGVLLDSHDTWFGPTDVCLAPDGALYVSDFFDQRTAHPDPDANWDRSNGRIYKLTAAGAKPPEPVNLAKLTSQQLVKLLSHSNHWFADRARIELAHRRDPNIVDDLRKLALQTKDKQLALQGFWALNVTDGLDGQLAIELLDHPYSYVRYWAVRLIGDQNVASRDVADKLIRLAASEASPNVRAQLAATAKRLPAADGLQIVAALLQHSPHEQDPRIPWLIWWAIENKATSHCELAINTFSQIAMWQNAAARENNLRLVRRYSAEGTSAGYEACVRMLKTAPDEYLAAAQDQLRLGLSERAVGLQGIGQGGFFSDLAAADTSDPGAERRNFEPLSSGLKDYIQRLWTQERHGPQQIELALRAGLDDAYPALRSAAFGSELNEAQRVALIAMLSEFGRKDDAHDLLKLVAEKGPDAVKLATLDVLATLESPEISITLLGSYASMSPQAQLRTRDVLFGRPASALAFLQYVDTGKINSTEVPTNQLRRLALLKNKEIDDLVRKHWGNIGPGTTEEKLATMRRFNNDLRAGTGDPAAGKLVFAKTCAVCHQLNGEGNKVGPDLTAANRSDRAALLANIVDPSAVIRREFLSYVVITTSGRIVTGVMAEQDAASITVIDANNQRTKISRGDVDELKESDVSLMPERLLDPLTPQQLRDLFSYVQDMPPAHKGT